MKRIYSFLFTLLIVLGGVCIASAEVIMLPDFVITEDGEITDYYGGEWVVVPEDVEGTKVVKIGEQAFFDLVITDVYLSEGLVEIGKSAFEGCNAVSVDIPSTVKVIGECAFANCRDLSTLFISFDENTVIGADAFAGTGRLLFYINCDVDAEILNKNLLTAKGDKNFEVDIRHVKPEYDEEGNVVCGVCGYQEQYDSVELPFSDVSKEDWYYDAVKVMYKSGIIKGKTTEIFDPDSGMTCGEAAKIAASVHSLFNEPIPLHTKGAWYQPYVEYCYENELIGRTDTFDWDKPITRAEMAHMFYNCIASDFRYEDINEVPISDIPDISEDTPYADKILTLYNKGIIVGDERMEFHPDDGIRRCEAAMIVARMLDRRLRIELPKG